MPSFLPPLPLFTTVPSSAPPKRPNSHRALHLQNVLALLQLSLLRSDFPRARRAWRILATCREIGWEGTYRFEGALTRGIEEEGEEREEWLEGLRRGGGREVIPLLQTYIYHLLSLSPPRPTKALDILEIYITSIPYAASPALHGLAAVCALGKGIESEGGATYDYATAKTYIQSALDLLPEQDSSSSSDEDSQPRTKFKATTKPTSTRSFYLSLLKLTEAVARWGSGARHQNGGGGDERSDGSEDEEEKGEEEEEENGMRRKKSRISRRNSLEGEEEGEDGGERMVVGEEGEGVEEKRDERHESLREGEEGEGMMDLS